MRYELSDHEWSVIKPQQAKAVPVLQRIHLHLR